jgi:RNA polymerase sigma-70 factor, ECF subfamily
MLTDQQLMSAIAAGDQQAYAEAVNRFARSIAAYAYRMTGRERDAEDIAQETMLRLWTQAHRWDPDKAELSTWLHRIARNLCIDFLRRDKSALSEEISGEQVDAQIAIDQQLDRDADVLRLRAAVAQLPERQRSALIMTHFGGLSNREVACILDVTVDALESLLARARRSLKSKLANEHNNMMNSEGAYKS